MQRFRQILLHVWREACRHIEIDESTRSIASLLVTQMPLKRIIVRRFEADPASIATVAVAPLEAHTPVAEHRRGFSAEEFKRLLAWGNSDRVIRRGKRPPGALGLILPPDIA